MDSKVKEIEFWQNRAKQLATDKIDLRDRLDIEINQDIDKVLKRNEERNEDVRRGMLEDEYGIIFFDSIDLP